MATKWTVSYVRPSSSRLLLFRRTRPSQSTPRSTMLLMPPWTFFLRTSPPRRTSLPTPIMATTRMVPALGGGGTVVAAGTLILVLRVRQTTRALLAGVIAARSSHHGDPRRERGETKERAPLHRERPSPSSIKQTFHTSVSPVGLRIPKPLRHIKVHNFLPHGKKRPGHIKPHHFRTPHIHLLLLLYFFPSKSQKVLCHPTIKSIHRVARLFSHTSKHGLKNSGTWSCAVLQRTSVSQDILGQGLRSKKTDGLAHSDLRPPTTAVKQVEAAGRAVEGGDVCSPTAEEHSCWERLGPRTSDDGPRQATTHAKSSNPLQKRQTSKA